jgi:PRTRC genetic system protein C
MSIKIEQVERKFKYNALVLDDPDPAMTPEQVKDYYADIYPELTQAGIEGPEFSDTTKEYEFKKAVGTKGAGEDSTTVILLSESRIEGADLDLELMDGVARALRGGEGEALLPPSEALGMV